MQNTLLQILPFLVLVLAHHFLLAPLLRKKRWLYVVLTTLLLGAFTLWCFARPRFETGDGPGREMVPPPDMPPMHRPGPLRPEWMELAVGVLLVSGDLGLIAFLRMRQNERQMQELRAENLHQQLESLRYQINPHFFMNTLNNIQSLILTDPDKATEAVSEFSKLMRIVLYEGNDPVIPLARELEYLRNYLSLMRLRYPDSVRIESAFPEECGQAVVPPLLLASFVENAFKHGISYNSESFVKVAVEHPGRRLVFRCSNSCHDKAEAERHGLGLDNVRKRLTLLYDASYALRTEEKDNAYEVFLEIPETPKKIPA